MSSLGQIQVRSTTFHPLPRNLGGVCGYLPGKSRPYFYAQSTALDLLCQDLSSDPKNIYFYFIKYCIKVKNLGISSNFQSYFFVGLDQSHTRLWPKNMLTRRISVYLQNPQKRKGKKNHNWPSNRRFYAKSDPFSGQFPKISSPDLDQSHKLLRHKNMLTRRISEKL